MPTTITIRDVPDDTRDRLAARAARGGRSLQEYLRSTLIELAGKPDVNELMDRVATRKRATGTTMAAETILAHKDADKR